MPIDDLTPYRWQDHVVTPRRATLNLMATALIVAVVATADLSQGRSPDPAAALHVAAASKQTPSLAKSAKRPAALRPRPEAFGGC